MSIFHRRSSDLFKALVIRFPKQYFCSIAGGNVDDRLGSDSHGKELDLVLACLRVDRVAASGFGIGRK